jgi:acyl-CoA synthetase (AMP-forming)/AMP-acid ligase II
LNPPSSEPTRPDLDANIARHLRLMAASQPDTPALKVPRGRTADGRIDYLSLSFRELAAEADAWTARLQSAGVRRGDRTLVMVRPGLPLIAAVFGLFQFGAVPVVIDPGMGLKSFLACVARSRPRALVGIPMARLIRHLFRPSFRTVEVTVPVSGSLTARLPARTQISDLKSQIVASAASDLAAVLFTSGSTGAPKGVCYEHGMFEAQVRLIREAYDIRPGEVDLPMLPIFALFNPALGMTTIVPEIDPSRPATVDPARIVQAIQQEKVTNSFGSPTLWGKIDAYCRARELTLPSLRRVLCAGAPVPAALWQGSAAWLPHGQLHSPYGATEALPVATVSAAEIAALSPPRASPARHAIRDMPGGAVSPGACLGRPMPGIEVRIIAISDAPIATLGDARALPPGEIGEIIVRGPVVTKEYDALPEATSGAKIAAGRNKDQVTRNRNHRPDGTTPLGASPLPLETSSARSPEVWHRMGDCGLLDAEGRLWFCGRKAERVETGTATLFTEPCEMVFRQNRSITRCALVGLGEPGRQEPALVVEWKGSPAETGVLAVELPKLAASSPQTAAIRQFFFHPNFPVDVRHNAKIHRLTLARWAAEELRKRPARSETRFPLSG